MSLGVLGYAGQAAIGMDESARRRRAREEEEMKLAQQRRAESEAQRMAALEAFARRDISSTPIPQAPAGLTIPVGTIQPQPATSVAPTAGVTAPTAPTAPTTPTAPAAPTGPTREAQLAGLQNQLGQLRSSGGQFTSATPAYMKQEAELLKQIKALETQAAPPQAAPPQAGLLTPQQAQDAYATAEGKDQRFLGLIATGSESAVPEGTRKRLAQQYGGVRTPEAKQAEQQVVNTAKQQQQQVAQQIAAETTPPQFYSTNPARLPEDYQMAIQQRERLVQLAMQYQNNPATAELYQGYLTKIADVDATLRSMLQSQAIEVFRAAGDPTYLAGELTKKYGRQVQITPLPEGRYQVMIQGGRKPYVADTAKLVEDSMGLFSEEYRQAQIDIRNKLALEQMKSVLRMDEKEFEVAAEAILSGKVEAIKASFKDDARVVRDPMTQKEVVFVMKGGRMFFVDPQSTRVNPMTGQTSSTQKPSIVEVTTPDMN